MLKSLLFYPAMVVERFRDAGTAAQRFTEPAAQQRALSSLVSGDIVTFETPGFEGSGAGGVLVPMPDGSVASCLFFYADMRDSQDEAQKLADEYGQPGGEFEGHMVLVMSVGTTQVGRA